MKPLVAERNENGPFESIDDFCRRADVSGLNRRTLESLVKAGAFDGLGSRGAVFAALDQIMATAQLETRTRNSGQTSLFGGMDQGDAPQMAGISLAGLDVTSEEKAAWEKELLGVSLSYNPLMALAAADMEDGINSVDQLDEDMQGLTYTLVGHVASVTERYTREQKKFLVVSYDLLGGPVEVLVWPDVLERTGDMWATGKLLRATGKLRLRGDGYSLACDQVAAFVSSAPQEGARETSQPPVVRESSSPAQENDQSGNDNGSPNGARRNGGNGAYRHQGGSPYGGRTSGNGNGNGKAAVGEPGATTVSIGSTRTVFVGITESDDPVEDAHLLREVISLLLEYPGKDRVNLEIHSGGRRVLMDLPVVSTGYCEDLRLRLENLLGSDSVLLQGADGPDVDDVPF